VNLVVAITGGIGSGKSAVSDRLHRLGADVVDTDVIARELTGPGGPAVAEIRERFGTGYVAADGSLDRAAMRALAFSDPAAKARLEGLLHPLIVARSLDLLAAAHSVYAVLVAPLLVESGLATYRGIIDRVVVVDCPDELRIERTMRRSSLTRSQVEGIIASQASRERRIAIADDVVDNAGGPEALDVQVLHLHRQYLTLAERKVAARARA